jgi:hypothetical protein
MRNHLIAAAFAAALFPAVASAGQGVTSPWVTEGKTDLYTDGYYTFGDDPSAVRERLTVDYGIHDKLSIRGRLSFQEDAGEAFEWRYAETGLKYEVADEGELWVDTSIYGALIVRENGKVDLGWRFIFGKKLEDWTYTANLILYKEIGEEAPEIRPQARARAAYDLGGGFSTGLEYFGNFGSFEEFDEDAGQQAGTFLRWNIPDTRLHSEIGFLAGLNHATPDGMLKWRLGVSF